MAAGTLIIAMIFFAARGYFLGLAGVFARVLGLLCGYFIGFSYRSDLAAIITARTDTAIHPLVLQMISGALLFFGTMFLVSLLIIGLFKLLATLLPPFRSILTKEATGSRIAGALANSGIAAMLVLTGLYIYGLTLGKNQKPDELQMVANRFGDAVIGFARQMTEDNEHPAARRSDQSSVSIAPTPTKTDRGTAEIISSLDPAKRLLLEQVSNVLDAKESTEAQDLQSLLNDEQLQGLINNPELRKQAMDYMQANPQQMMDALNNPRFRELLEQWEPH